jgi:NAD(P)H-nitrite reductase large subunit
LFVAGDGAGLRGSLVAEVEGTIVGAAAACGEGTTDTSLMQQLAPYLDRRRQYETFQNAVRTLLHVPLAIWNIATDDTIVCRCENVRCSEVRSALAAGHNSPNALKRNTRAGMGMCGGRTCMHAIAALTELQTGEPAAAMMTPRPLARPVTFSALAQQQKKATAS